MSHENVEAVRGLLPSPDTNMVTELLFRGDDAGWEAFREQFLEPLFDDDFAFAAQLGEETMSSRGLDGWRHAWLDWLEPWESYRSDIQEVVDAGDRVFIHARDFARRPGMEAEVELSGASNIWTFRDGKVLRIEHFTDEAAAREAAGLSGEARR